MKLRNLFAALAMLLLLTGCVARENGRAIMATPTPGGTIMFRVGDTVVTVEEFQQRMAQDIGDAIQGLLAQGQTPDQIIQLADQQDVRRSIFDSMLQEEILVQQARREGVGIDPAQVDQIADLQESQIDLLKDEAGAFGRALDQRLSSIREQLVLQMVVQHTTADMFRARHIFVADEATADALLAELAEGRSFAALAEQYSLDPESKDMGGDLGWRALGDLGPEFDQFAFTAPLREPVKLPTQGGWHVVELLDRQEDRPFGSLEALQRSQNGQAFYQASFLPWYEQLRAELLVSGDLQIAPGFDPNSVPLPFLQ